MTGLATALQEITLVLFTTLAPSGALAFALTGLPNVLGRTDGRERRSVDRLLCVPLVTVLLGLVASATHLGNPSNALYVLAGVGRSPLSNEVCAAVVFLALAGLYWLYSFAERPRRALQRTWLALTGLAGIAFVGFAGVAYNVATVPTWSNPLVPASLYLGALAGGPVMARACLLGAGWQPARGRVGAALLAVGALALAANVVALALQGASYGELANEVTTAYELVPAYGLLVAGYAVLGTAGVALAWRSGRASDARRSATGAAVGTALVLSGIFLTRFAFYMAHMTVGLGV